MTFTLLLSTVLLVGAVESFVSTTAVARVSSHGPRCAERRTKRRPRGRATKRRQAQVKPPSTPLDSSAQPAATPPEAAPAVPSEARSVPELLAQAQRHYDGLDYDKVPPLVAQVLEHDDLPVAQRCDAYRLQGLSVAIIGDPTDAGKSFRELLQACPDFDLSPDTAPRVLAAFRSVQVEVQAQRAAAQERARQELIATLGLEGQTSSTPTGGIPIVFAYRLRDPKSVVRAVHVLYRRAGESDYSSLPLQRAEDQSWSGEIPGGWSVNEDGFVLQYFVSTADAAGETLYTLGDAARPMTVDVGPGSMPGETPFYKTVWFWAVTTTGVLAAGAASAVAIDRARQLPETDLGTTQIR